MKLLDFGFLSLHVLDLLDIFAVAILLYGMYKIVRGSIALNIFMGFLFIYIFWFVVKALNMRLLSTILGQFIGVGAIAMLVVFQQEIRRFLLLIGKNHIIFSNGISLSQILPWNWGSQKEEDINFDEIALACHHLSATHTGALMIVARTSDLKFYGNTGITMDAELSAKLIETIFYKKSPLHDGAVIIVKNKVIAASCILPVSERQDLPTEYGLRHRSALGISEHTDAMAIIVSEETGNISIATKGELSHDIAEHDLALHLYQEYYEIAPEDDDE